MQGDEPQNQDSVEETLEQAVEQDAPVADEVAELQAQLAAAEEKAAKNYDLALRTQAEMENVKRRSSIDLEKAHKFALEKFANDLLPVKDSMEMGLAAGQGADEGQIEKLVEGVELTLKMFVDVLSKNGVEEVDPQGEKFNPEHHQAMTMIPHPEAEANTIIEVMQKGYLLNERLIRPAMVVVSKGNG